MIVAVEVRLSEAPVWTRWLQFILPYSVLYNDEAVKLHSARPGEVAEKVKNGAYPSNKDQKRKFISTFVYHCSVKSMTLVLQGLWP